jgi:hypothetical protein
MPRERPSRHTARLHRQLAELRGIQLLHVKLYQRSRIPIAHQQRSPRMSSKISWSGPRLAGSPPVPQPVELLEPAFALRPRPSRYRWARTEFPGEVFEQDLLFRRGQFVHGGFVRGKVARPVQLRQTSTGG